MKKFELAAMTVAELKALARKKKVSLSAKVTKADIIGALMASDKNGKAAAKPSAVKKSARTKATAKKDKTAVAKTTTAEKASAQGKLGKNGKGQTRKTAAPKQTTTLKQPAAQKPPEPAAPVYEWKSAPRSEEPFLAQERMAESKYYTGPARRPAVAGRGELPTDYGEDRIVLMTKDPFVVHSYWEATPPRLERERAWFGWGSKICVRIYDVTGVQFDGRNAVSYFDQEVPERTGNWYFDLGRPGHSFCADLGLLSAEGRFLTLARSNYVTMPRDTVSEEIDEEWLLVDDEFWELYGYPEGVRGRMSSAEFQEMLRRRRAQEISSPGLFSWGRPRRR